MRIAELPFHERPRTRVTQRSPQDCNDAELVAALLGLDRLDTAYALLQGTGGLTGLSRLRAEELQQLSGVGPVRAAQLVAAAEYGRRIQTASDRPLQIRSPADAAQLLMSTIGLHDQEHLVTVLLNTKNHVLGVHTVYIGSVNSAIVRVGEVYKEAIRRNCPAIILAHNHPSGDCTPSAEDVLVTRQIVEAGTLLDVELLDHLVVSRSAFVSLRERGLGFRMP